MNADAHEHLPLTPLNSGCGVPPQSVREASRLPKGTKLKDCAPCRCAVILACENIR
jgi:hypothetical protein